MSSHHQTRKFNKKEKLKLLDLFEDEQLKKIRKIVQLHKNCKLNDINEDTVENSNPKNELLWDNEDCVRKNAFDLHMEYCKLRMETIYQFITCKTAKELRDSIREAHGGSHKEITLLLKEISPKEPNEHELDDSIHEPPILSANGSHFGYWKVRMRVYIIAHDPQLWHIIEHGPLKITKLDKNGVQVEKLMDECDENDFNKLSKNARAWMTLFSGLTYDMSKRFVFTKTAKNFWKALNDFYEGSDDRKRDKIYSLICECYSFKLNKGESISHMFDRFYTIVGQLALLGEEVTMSDKVQMILGSLPEDYKILVVKIRVSDISTGLSLNDLYPLVLAREEQIKISRKMHKG